MKNNKKFLGLDIIRVLSMFCVIFLHCASNRLRVEMSGTGWDTINVFTAFATCGVPMFFMISGALVLKSENTLSIKYTLKDRVLKVFVPMVVWSVIAVMVRLYTSNDLTFSVGDFYSEMIMFFYKPTAVHLWFMYYLIPMYLISPALKVFVDKADKKVVLYIILLWLLQIISLTLSGMLKGDNQKFITNVSFINNIGFISGYLGYFILGWYLFENKINVSGILLALTAVISVIIISIGTKAITDYNGYYTETFKSYRSIFVVVLSASVFLIIYKIDKLPNFLTRIISMLASVSYGVYLSHNVLIDLLNKWGIRNYRIVDVLLSFFIAGFGSIILVFILSKIRYISYVFVGIKKNKNVEKRSCNLKKSVL